MTCLSVLTSGVPSEAVVTYLRRAGMTPVTGLDPAAAAVLVLGTASLTEALEDALLAVAAAGTPVLLVGATMSTALTDAAGFVPGRLLPVHPVRVRPGRDAGEVTARLGADELVLTDCWPVQDKVADDVEQVLTANSAYADHPVATWRPAAVATTSSSSAVAVRTRSPAGPESTPSAWMHGTSSAGSARLSSDDRSGG